MNPHKSCFKHQSWWSEPGMIKWRAALIKRQNDQSLTSRYKFFVNQIRSTMKTTTVNTASKQKYTHYIDTSCELVSVIIQKQHLMLIGRFSYITDDVPMYCTPENIHSLLYVHFVGITFLQHSLYIYMQYLISSIAFLCGLLGIY